MRSGKAAVTSSSHSFFAPFLKLPPESWTGLKLGTTEGVESVAEDPVDEDEPA